MATKKAAPAAPASSNEILRFQGYGAVPAFKDFCRPDEEFAPGAVVNGCEISIICLIDDQPALAVADAWMRGTSDVSAWEPTRPEGDGWYLALVAGHEEPLDSSGVHLGPNPVQHALPIDGRGL